MQDGLAAHRRPGQTFTTLPRRPPPPPPAALLAQKINSYFYGWFCGCCFSHSSLVLCYWWPPPSHPPSPVRWAFPLFPPCFFPVFAFFPRMQCSLTTNTLNSVHPAEALGRIPFSAFIHAVLNFISSRIARTRNAYEKSIYLITGVHNRQRFRLAHSFHINVNNRIPALFRVVSFR